jgi:hypothetical protein
MVSTPISNEHLHFIFVYCDDHNQGAVAIITREEWLDITTLSESNNYYYEKIFKYVITMCGRNSPECMRSWRCCGNLEYIPYRKLIPQDELLIGKGSVQTNFDGECGGWKFNYFKNELFTSQGHIEEQLIALPRVVREYLSHLDGLPTVSREP